MNEIPKNVPNIPQTQKVEQIKPEVVQEETAPIVETPAKEINEIPENPADRSAVKVDNLENDMKIFAANPELAAKALEVGEIAEQNYAAEGAANPEFKGLAVTKAFADEFQK